MRMFKGWRDAIFPGRMRTDQLVLPASRTAAIMVDHGYPVYTWRDLEGEIRPRTTGAGNPTLSTFRDNQRLYSFAANDVVDIIFHWPHDWVVGSPAYIHTHWGHNGTGISGQLVLGYRTMFAKGHAAHVFGAERTLTHTISSLSMTNAPQYVHRIDEIKLVEEAGSAATTGEYTNDEMEVDGLLLVSLIASTIPTITGGIARPFIIYSDIHYLSSNIGTPNRAPNFYVRP